ncbi:MAG: hypothetical protein ABI807_07310 [Sporichthyaceae bacterium]
MTGSRFVLEAGGHRVLVDCGLFQGADGTDEAGRGDDDDAGEAEGQSGCAEGSDSFP